MVVCSSHREAMLFLYSQNQVRLEWEVGGSGTLISGLDVFLIRGLNLSKGKETGERYQVGTRGMV